MKIEAKYSLLFVPVIFSLELKADYSSAIVFNNIADDPGSGLWYQRVPSSNNEILDHIKAIGFVDSADPQTRSQLPVKPRGAPGVVIFDYDQDGDQDIYVTNGLVPNSLFHNKLVESGETQFVDVAIESGVAASDQDSTGACAGDLDNDGDADLLVLGVGGTPNRLFENKGAGEFEDISSQAFDPSDIRHPSGCSIGDINGDGLLDIAIANTFNSWNHRMPLVTFDNDHLLEANQLFINQGGNVFQDRSVFAGIADYKYISWAISLVDYDLDGDVDLITADDQGAKAPFSKGGRDDGYIRIFDNDGSGRFTNVTADRNTHRYGAWMGLAFGDFNADQYMDLFSTNTGYYITSFLQPGLDFENEIGDWTSGWFLGGAGLTFTFPGAGEMIDTPFGWGTSVIDYDNDGDSDIVYHGGVNMGLFVEASNPGVVLNNDGSAHFKRDVLAMSETVDHLRRNVQGMAVGDLNNDGFMDIVSVSSEDWPSFFPLVPLTPPQLWIGTPFDQEALLWPTFFPVDPQDFSQGFVWSQMEPSNGTLAVELNSGGNGNSSARIKLNGSIGQIAGGRVNRDGIGAVVTFQLDQEKSAMWPVVAGSSYASQDSLTWVFGMGGEKSGVLEVLWPGGVRNKLYNVRAGEEVLFPEIPCNYTSEVLNIRAYKRCVKRAVKELQKAGVIDRRMKRRYFGSAMRAYVEHKYVRR